jgi:uncharacterized protein
MAEPVEDRTTTALLERLVGFGRYVRASGLPVGTGRVLMFCRAAAVLDPTDPSDLRLAARATLVSRPEDFPVLDAAFDRYFDEVVMEQDAAEVEGLTPEGGPGPGRPEIEDGGRIGPVAARWSRPDIEEDPEGETGIRIVASEAEVLRTKDFAELTPEERRAVLSLIRRLMVTSPVKWSRRLSPARRTERFDLRRTVRRSLKTEGEPIQREWRSRRTRQRPLVLLLDVSGSMAPYGRPLVEFAHAAAIAGRWVEVFCFGTRLTRISRALRSPDPEAVLAAVGRTVIDWEGGTRIGDSLKQLLDGWSARSALRGSVVVICSDGLERGDPAFLAAQMGRVSRLAHRVVWVNPLKGSPRYQPLARGMAASLPFVDVFLPGHNLESLEALSASISA